MAADVINVQFGALRASADSLAAKAKALDDYLDQLSSNLAPLKASWYASGSSAGTAAEQSETRLRAATAEISQIIAQFSSKTTEAHDLQLALENKNASFFA